VVAILPPRRATSSRFGGRLRQEAAAAFLAEHLNADSSRSDITTREPAANIALATSQSYADAPPVTTATLPSNPLAVCLRSAWGLPHRTV
jgi:hypothetical protein